MTIIQRLGDAALYVALSLEDFFNLQAAHMPDRLPLPCAIQKGRALLENIQQRREPSAPVFLRLQVA